MSVVSQARTLQASLSGTLLVLLRGRMSQNRCLEFAASRASGNSRCDWCHQHSHSADFAEGGGGKEGGGGGCREGGGGGGGGGGRGRSVIAKEAGQLTAVTHWQSTKASLSGTFLQILPVFAIEGALVIESPRICPPIWRCLRRKVGVLMRLLLMVLKATQRPAKHAHKHEARPPRMN